MNEINLLKDGAEEIDKEGDSGIHSIKIENLGHLRQISKQTMITISKLVNFGVDIVRLVIFPTGIHSKAYTEIKSKANQFKDEAMEFHIMRLAMEIIGAILKKPSVKEDSSYDRILKLIGRIEKQGKKISLQRCIVEAMQRSLKDPEFEKELLKQLEQEEEQP